MTPNFKRRLCHACGLISAIFLAFVLLIMISFYVRPAHSAELVGDGPFLILDEHKRVVGTVVDGKVIALDVGKFVPKPRGDNPPTIRFQLQQVRPIPPRWNPEPETCPRGVKVLRGGVWGC